MNHQERIVIDPEILVGKPVVKGTRLSVDFLLGLLAQGWSEAEILRNYPGLEREDLRGIMLPRPTPPTLDRRLGDDPDRDSSSWRSEGRVEASPAPPAEDW